MKAKFVDTRVSGAWQGRSILLLSAWLCAFICATAPAPAWADLRELLRQAEDELRQGDLAAADAGFRAALRLAQESGDRPAQATARNGIARAFPPDRGGALAQLRLALAIHRDLGDLAGEASDLVAMGEVFQLHGSSSEALEPFSQALALQRRLGLAAEEVRTLGGLAMAQYSLGLYEEALFGLDAALERSRSQGESSREWVALATRLGELNAELGRYSAAVKHLESAVAGARNVRSRLPPPPLEQAQKRWEAHAQDLLQGKGLDVFAGAPPEGEPDEPALLRAQLEALAEDYEEKSRKLDESIRVRASTSPPIKSARDAVASREFQDFWLLWLRSIASLLADPGLKEMERKLGGASLVLETLIDGASSINQAAVSRWRLQALPEEWGTEQARQLNQLLRSNGYRVEVTVDQIGAAERGQAGSPMAWPPSMEEMYRDSFAAEARKIRKLIADPNASLKDLQAPLLPGPWMSRVRSVVLGNQQRLKEEMSGGASPEEVKGFGDSWGVLGCEIASLRALSQIYFLLGETEAAGTARDQSWDLLREVPDFVRGGGGADTRRTARKLGLPVPPTTLCHPTNGPAPDLWAIDLQAAAGQVDQAIENYLSKAAAEPSLRPAAWTRIASLYVHKGNKARALDFYKKAIDAVEALQGQLRLETLVASWSSRQEPLYAQTIELLHDLGQPEPAFEYAERARARAFLNQIGNRRLSTGGAPPELAAELYRVRQRLIEIESFQARGQTSTARLDPAGSSLREEEEARRLYESLLVRIARANPEYASLVRVDTASLAQVQKDVLDADTSLIEYFVLNDKTLAWVIDRDQVQWVTLKISAQDLHRRVAYLRNLIAVRDPLVEEEAQRLHAEIFAPVEPFLRHAHLVIVPHGPLHYLPFAALRSRSRGRYVAEDFTLTLAPSASSLRFVLAKGRPLTPNLLALGDPDGSLPSAAREVEAIASLYGSSAWLGKEARESRLFQESGKAGIVHLAAHTRYDPHRPLFTRVELAAGGGSPPNEEHADGNLHVYEVYDLDLQRAGLVVLSSCETALGPRDEGDDLVGLQRAFLYAGSPAVVTSLWPVDDDATRTFMEAFHRRLRQGGAASEALRVAQRELLQQPAWRAPYFWAAFTLSGDWRGSR